jgi:Flp pilus assembly pilin Flp
LGLSSHPGERVSFWICRVSIATSLPVALKVGPVLYRVSVVLITGIVADRITDLSAGLTGLWTNPCKRIAGSSEGAEVLAS